MRFAVLVVYATSSIAASYYRETSREFFEKQNKLVSHILSGYRKEIPPLRIRDASSDIKSIVVDIKLAKATLLSVNEPSQTVDMLIEYYMESFRMRSFQIRSKAVDSFQTWNDERLSWNPSDFDEISGFYINQSLIWRVDVLVFNSRSLSGVTPASQHVYVHYDGNINSFLYDIVSFTCLMNASMRDFPFDKQVCSVEFTSFSFRSRELLIDCGLKNFSSSSASNNEWLVDNITCSRSIVKDHSNKELDFYMVKFTFQMRRFCLTYVVSIIMPSFVLTLLCVLGMFWSRFNHNDNLTKVGCGLSAIVAMCTVLQIAEESMPKTRELPSLSVYIMANLMLISVSIAIITTASKHCHLAEFAMCCSSRRWFRRLDLILNVDFQLFCLLVFSVAAVVNLLMLVSKA